MFSGSSPCLLEQHGSCSSDQLPMEHSENMLQNLFLNLPPQTVPFGEQNCEYSGASLYGPRMSARLYGQPACMVNFHWTKR